MATNVAKSAPQTTDVVDEITIDEFCRRLSNTDKRVEMIGGFHADEKRAGRFKNTEARYRARFEAFVNKPV